LLINFFPGNRVDKSLELMQSHPLGVGASLLSHVGANETPAVILQSRIGAHRIVDMFTGEQLPRIC
jgi:hydrogenase expression/formation protein HypE